MRQTWSSGKIKHVKHRFPFLPTLHVYLMMTSRMYTITTCYICERWEWADIVLRYVTYIYQNVTFIWNSAWLDRCYQFWYCKIKYINYHKISLAIYDNIDVKKSYINAMCKINILIINCEIDNDSYTCKILNSLHNLKHRYGSVQ